ncbi:FAD-binding oxidoreductase [Paenibacillaceae bacterium]|nr:FAD-binding oxidoreductase [Paenibacillaceae bacterium]
MAVEWEKEMLDLVGEAGFYLDSERREKLSKDYYWYSPILEQRLKDKRAEAIAVPNSEADIPAILSCAYSHKIPVTVRGAGTGNYGQAVPLNGGIVMDLSRLNDIVETGDGYVRVQCGVKLGALEKYLRERDQELCIYPSTYLKATVGGFVSGGSGGIGSITWGNLWDGNVLAAVVYTLEAEPRRLVVEGDDLKSYIHSYGTAGVVSELTIRTAPKTEWVQSIVQCPDLKAAMQFAEQLSRDHEIGKRLVSVSEWPIPSYFIPFAKYMDEGATAVLLETADGSLPSVEAHAQLFGGSIKHTIPADKYHRGMGLSDFTWNHTTLWALKNDSTLTYLQAGFTAARYVEQIEEIRANFPDEVLLHFEWITASGQLTPASLPIVRFQSEERLYEIIAFLESIGVRVNDPHTYVLDYGTRGAYENMLKRKAANDPLGLLNPGKINMNPMFS